MYKNILICLFKILFILLLCLGCDGCDNENNTTLEMEESQIPDLNTVGEVIMWCEANLYYKNVDPWDRAPSIESVIRDGYGDCKMLAGVVSVLLDSVGQPNLIIVNKEQKTYHIFNTYEHNGRWHIVDNARAYNWTFLSFEEIKDYYEISDFEKTFEHYNEFQEWWNTKFFKKNYTQGG